MKETELKQLLIDCGGRSLAQSSVVYLAHFFCGFCKIVLDFLILQLIFY